MPTLLHRLRANISSVYLGNSTAVDQVVCCLLARGHVLIEDVPGVGKTVLATALAKSIDCTFSRIQLTPDMLPSDILGVSVFVSHAPAGQNGTAAIGGGGAFEFKPGPIFANIVLADEINRTPPRTQTALLEAMSEATVTVDGRSYRLDQPFMIVATQNPFDFEGTYPLPENQLDRFFMRLSLGYPSAVDEARVLAMRPADNALHTLKPVLHAKDVLELQQRVEQVTIDRSLIEYIIAIATATRGHERVHVGLSPRGTLALAQAARASAALAEREYVVPEDVLNNLLPVCAHRLVVKGMAAGGRSWSGGTRLSGEDGAVSYPPGSAESILLNIVQGIPSPA